MWKLFMLELLFGLVFVSQQSIQKEEEKISPASLREYFNVLTEEKYSSIEIIKLSNFGNEFIRDINIKGKILCEVKSSLKFSSNSKSNGIVFVLAEDFFTFASLAKKLSSLNIHPHAFYTIVLLNIAQNEMKKVFAIMWALNAYNVNILKRDELFTFIPFRKKLCNDVSPLLMNKFTNNTWSNSNVFFPEKLSNLNNCTIKVSALNNPFTVIKTYLPNGTFTLDGTEVKLIRELSKALNFHAHIDCNETLHGSIFDNGTATDNIKRVVEGVDDIILGAFYLRATRAKFLSFTQFYRLDYTKIVGPLDPLYTPAEILLRPFDLSMWIMLSLLLLFGMFSISVIRKLMLQTDFSREIAKVLHINLIIMIFGGSQNLLPRENSLRILFAFFAMFCLIVRTVYQGSLFTFMQTNDRKKGPTTVDAMVDLKYNFYLTQSFTEFTSELSLRHRFVSRRFFCSL
jgi:hypothetical protein